MDKAQGAVHASNLSRRLRRRNWQPLPMGIQDVDAVVLTHAHLDHSGFIPVLYRHGYRGPVFTHHATVRLCGLLWPDSGRIQEEDDPWQQLVDVVNETAAGGGVLLIPSFAVGRAQLLQHMLVTLMAERKVPRMPIFLDSPMAIKASDIYGDYHEFHRLSDAQCQAAEKAVIYTSHVEDSKAIAKQTGPHIIIAGSGMATGGRILHHFKHWLGDHRATVLFSGHQAGGTRGAKMEQGVEHIKVHGAWLPVKARIRHLDGLSGHADYKEIGDWLADSKLPPDLQVHLVHGEPDALEAMSDYLKQTTAYDVNIAAYMGVLHMDNATK